MSKKSTQLAKFDMVRAETIAGDLWWSLMPGVTATVAWPKGWTKPDHLGNQFESVDPNDHWRPWLEKNVGRQNWDWGWRINISTNSVDIKFRRDHKAKMSMFLLKYT